MAWTKVQQQTITTSNTTNTFTWSGLTGYSHYMILISARKSRSSGSNAGYADININSADSADYIRGWVLDSATSNPFTGGTYVSGAAPEVYAVLGTDVGGLEGYSTVEVFIPFATQTWEKMIFVQGANAGNGASGSENHYFTWRSIDYQGTDPITSITIATESGDGQFFQAGSRFTLYGF